MTGFENYYPMGLMESQEAPLPRPRLPSIPDIFGGPQSQNYNNYLQSQRAFSRLRPRMPVSPGPVDRDTSDFDAAMRAYESAPHKPTIPFDQLWKMLLKYGLVEQPYGVQM